MADLVTPETENEAASLLAQTGSAAVAFKGAGTKADWGRPPNRLDLIVRTTKLTGVIDHAAGDMVAVVRAGTPLAQLQQVLAANGQQLAIDSPAAEATVGGVVAANVSGPRRLAYGTIRDLLIGVTIVRADGVIARAGGRVVKNVAGYDLGKLFTGSFGTLGLITECVFRLHPQPGTSITVTAPVDDPAQVLTAIRHAQLTPSAVEIDMPSGVPATLAILLEGGAAAARAEVAARLLGPDAVQAVPPWWNSYPWTAGGIGMKVCVPLSAVPALSTVGVHLRGSAGTGVLYASVPPERVAQVRDAARKAGGHSTVITSPQLIDEDPVPGINIMRRIKNQFDPSGRLAPGTFVAGI